MDSGMGMAGVGILLLLYGGGLTTWSYVNRDPVTGEFFIWWKSILVGVVFVIAGLIWHSKENEPLV